MSETLNNYKYQGAKALVILHDKHMRQCLEVWKQAKVANVKLPQTDDPSYQSLETLLEHILSAARHFMVWMCKQLELPDPEIKPAPDVDKVETEADSYLEHVLERWRLPLADIPEEKFTSQTYGSNWGALFFCIDSMLEHAVMHPIRHQFQLENLIKEQS
jgi:uncharacterized damage-inducible protein DinB